MKIKKTPPTEYRKLRRPEATMLADFARREKKMDLTQGWLSFYRLTPEEIHRQFPQLSIDEIVQQSRLQMEAEA